MKQQKFWKVILRYGHVGQFNEISVARYLAFPSHFSIMDVCDHAKTMPGVKDKGVVGAKQITFAEFKEGRREESYDFYLQKLKTFNPRTA
ncbi:MAG: hypothetical protein UHX00_00755 [Caryophanon sp.]|nr:hypothetical protein [Caryophanon sp.]